MTMNLRIAFCAISLLFLGSEAAPANAATITSGTVSMYWDGSLSGFQLSGAATQLNGEVLQSPPLSSLSANTTADLSSTISTTQASNHPFPATINGTSYPSVWVKGTFTFAAQPLLIPLGSDGALASFSTPFTMQGQFDGFADQAMTQPLFSVSLSGSGTATIGPLRNFSNNTWAFAGGGSESFTFAGALPAPWTSTDIGAVGQAGVASFATAGSVFDVAGAGADIWGSTDAFQFVSQPLAADGGIVSRVDGEQDTNPFAKAGIMIRQTLDPGSVSVILDVKPNGEIEFMARPTTGADTVYVGGTTTVFSRPWLKLTRSGSAVTASISTDGSSWTVIGSAPSPLSGAAYVGLAVTSHDTAALNQATFDQVSVVAASTGSALSATWSQADVGNVGIAGSASTASTSWTVSGAGGDIWGTSDAYHFVYSPMNGDGEIDVRVVSVQNTNAYAKAGVMMRASLASDAANVMLDVKPDGGIEFMARTSAGASTAFIGGGFAAAFPVSLKLIRMSGTGESLFTAFVFDPASASWRQVGSTRISMPAQAIVGLAVTSHDVGTLNTAQFDPPQLARNLLDEGGFEEYVPPALGTPGWVSDTPLRQIPAKSETNQPHTGSQNGACWATTEQDCGLYQEVTASADGNYMWTMYANADRPGGLIGVNVNGVPVVSMPVNVRGFGNYGSAYSAGFVAHAGDVIRVWMYSPATPGYIVIDDAIVMQSFGPT
jgi:regulation of enolase protein 1 (concanavalin A-like superfamily)